MELSKQELSAQLYEVAIGLVKAGRSDMAENTYQLALELDPTDFQSITNLAVIIDKSGRFEQAEKLYLKAADYPFYDSFAMFNLGYLYGRTDRQELAETWYRRALAANPNYSEAMVNLAGLVQTLREDRAEAKSLLESAVRISPHDTIALSELANIHNLNQDKFLAEMFYWKAVESNPHSPLANYNFASFLHEIGETDAARRFFDLAHSLDKDGQLKHGNF
jgi:protein O-mannosyl-transferase